MPVNVVFLTILLFCLYFPPGISSNTDSDYDEIRILGLCDPDLHADCVTAFTQVLSDNDEMATHAILFNWSVLPASEDLVTGLREMDGVCSKYPYDIMVAFGQTPTMMTSMFTADAFNITLLAYDTTPGHVLSLEGSYMVQLNRSPYYTGEAMASLISRFGHSWVNIICQDRYQDDGFLSRFYEETAVYGIKTELNSTVSRSDNWTELQQKLKRFQRSAFKIIVLHCEVFVMRRVVQIGRVLNLFSNNYVWFLTDYATEHSRKADDSLPIGLVGLERTEPDGYTARVSSTLRTLLQYLQSDPVLDWGSSDISLTDYANYSLLYNYTSEPWVRDLKLSLDSSNEMAVPIGDGFIPPITNYSFQVLNLVNDQDGMKIWKEVGSLDNFYVNLSTMVELPGKRHNSTHRTRKLYRVITKISPPFIMQKEAFTESGECYSYAPCVQLQSGNDSDMSDVFEDYLLTNRYDHKKYDVSCCTGVTIDILVKLATDMEFDFILFFLKESPSGGDSGSGDANQTTYDSEIWNDTLQYLEDDLADIVAGPLSITVERMKYITYTEVYFYTGFSMITMKKERETSMDAFLKPFSLEVWLGIVISATVTAVATSLFEWNSPFGLNPKGRKRQRNYTLGSALTMVYSVLFGHIVRTKSPKSWPGKVLQNFWAGLAIFIIASYTANLAAYLAGRSEQSDLLNINDKRLFAMKVAVIENGAANYFLSKINPLINNHIFLRSTEEALEKLKSKEVDVFIHDTYLLKYAVTRLDDNCTVTFAGDSFGEDGYAFGLKKGSKLMDPLSNKILAYTSSGYIEELTKKYFTRKGCDPKWGHLLEIKYGPQHTAGLFVLLIVAITLSVLLMAGEYVLFKYLIPFLRKKPVCSRWRSINIMFLSQRFFRILNSDQLVSPQSAAREIMHIVRTRDFAKFFQKDEIKTTRALRRNPPPPRTQNIYDLASTMIRAQRQEKAAAMACDALDTTTDEEQRPLDMSDISPQYSSQLEFDSGCGSPRGGAAVPSKSVTNISALDLHGQMVSYSLISGFSDNSKSKDSMVNEEDILLNEVGTSKALKKGIENPAFASRDSEETSLSICAAMGGCGRVSEDDGDSESDDIDFGRIEERNGSGRVIDEIPLCRLDTNNGGVVGVGGGGEGYTGDANGGDAGGGGARVKGGTLKIRSSSNRHRRRRDSDDVNIDMESNVDDVISESVGISVSTEELPKHHIRQYRRSSAPHRQYKKHRYLHGGGSMDNINAKRFFNGDENEYGDDDDSEDKDVFTGAAAAAASFATGATSNTYIPSYEDGVGDDWKLEKRSSTNSSQSSMMASSSSAKNNVKDNTSDSSPGADGVSCCGSKDNASALLGVTPSEYYKRSLRMKDNRVKSTIRHHALRGVRPLLPATMIDECTIEALSKEDLLVMWKSSEIELQKRLGEVMMQKEKLKKLIAEHMQKEDV